MSHSFSWQGIPLSSLCEVIRLPAPPRTMLVRKGGKKTSRRVRSEMSHGAPFVPFTGWEPPTKCLAQANTSCVEFSAP